MNTALTALLGLILTALFGVTAPSLALVTPIGNIQQYDANTGAPASPYTGQIVTVQGAVYALKGMLTDGGFYLQDSTGGINYFAPFAEGISIGDSLRVTAPAYEYGGEIYLHDTDVAPEFQVISTGPAPEVSSFTVPALIASYENVGWLVGLSGTLSDISGDGFIVNADGAAVPIHVSALSGIDLTHLQDGRAIVVHGACVVRNGEIQVWPRSPLDVNGGHDPLTFHVSLTGSDLSGNGTQGNPYATIQKAIDVSADGDEVWVEPGTYTGDGNRDIDFKARAITVKSRDEDPTTCIIDCQGTESEPHRGFIFQNREGPDSILIGFTVTNGLADGLWTGGGILIRQTGYVDFNLPTRDVAGAASPTLRRLNVVGNTGGGLSRLGQALEPWSMLVTECAFIDNIGDGFVSAAGLNFGSMEIVDSVFSNNTGVGASLGNHGATVKGCEFRGNDEGGVETWSDGGKNIYLESCVIAGNQGHGYYTRGFYAGFSALDCAFDNNSGNGVWLRGDMGNYCDINSSSLSGNGMEGLRTDRGRFDRIVIDNCSIKENSSNGVSISHIGSDASAVFANSEICSNSRNGIEFSGRSLSLDSVTIAGNDSLGVTAAVDSLTSQRVISAFNGAAAVVPTGFVYLDFTCNDFFGNSGGDWTAPIADHFGNSGNISADPQFCDLTGNNLTLRSDSPCLEGNHPGDAYCGQIGAQGLGCYLTEPAILTIADVGNDQGRQVRLTWARSALDEAGSQTPILEYALFRQQPSGAGIDRSTYPSGDWDFLITVPADGENQYSVVAPTLGDSTITSGPYVSRFFVRARTQTPTVFFDSAPDSGYSIDNLVPNAPSNFRLYYGTPNLLVWEGGEDPDFRYFRIYDAAADTLLAATIALTWSDPTGSYDRTYKISAVDFAGNESATVAPVSTVSGVEVVQPQRFALLQNHPNPFNPLTTITYEVPRPTTVSVSIYDVAGRLIQRIQDGEPVPAGRHRIVWRGRDDHNQQVAAGVYFYVLRAGAYSETRRMTLVK